MVEAPLETPVATPVTASIVTKPLFDDHAPPPSPLLVTVTAEVGLMACVPLNVPALGVAVLVSTTSSVTPEQEPFETVHVNVALLPAETLVTPEL